MKVNQSLNENVIIRGVPDTHKQYYKSVAEYLKDKLGISSTVMVHTNMKGLFGGAHTGSTMPDPKRENIIHIFLPDGLSRAELLRAMCHEFVHVAQISTGRLALDIHDGKLHNMKWEGKEVTPEYNRNSPWELEAHIQEKSLLCMMLYQK